MNNRPNIIFILTDHFRSDFVGRYTPNLMALAERGVRFENAYCAAPLCQPARVSLITGMYPSQHGVCGNQSLPISSDLRDDTFMRRLQEAGYYTAHIGKHHYIDRYGIGMDVTEDDAAIRDYGYHDVIQVLDDGENVHNDDAYTAHLRQLGLLDTYRESFASNTAKGRHPFNEDDTADGFIGRHGIDFIDAFNGDRPFFLNLGFIGPHPPYWFPGDATVSVDEMPEPVGSDDTREIRERRARYTEKIKLIDRYVGGLTEALDRRGLTENTVIIFSSDHGDCLGDFGIWDKRYFYESSCGVPLILAGSGVPSGERMNGPRVSKALVSHLDIYPTILSIAGIESPVSRERVGRDMIAMAKNRPDSFHDAVFAELSTSMMIRTANWKLVFDPEQGGVRYLYNMFADPNEETNLAGVAGYERVKAELTEKMLAHRIRRTQFSHAKEEQRLQSVRGGR